MFTRELELAGNINSRLLDLDSPQTASNHQHQPSNKTRQLPIFYSVKMANSPRSILIVCAALFGIPLAAAQLSEITLYDDGDFQGGSIVMHFNGFGVCQNVPEHFENLASSVDTHGNCFRLWEQEGCHGRFHRVRPGSPAHNNLGEERVRFNDITSAVSSCLAAEW